MIPVPTPALAGNDIALGVDLATVASRIDPRLYGINDTTDRTICWTLYRLGGNSTTPYNWEINAENAGRDYIHNNGIGWSSRFVPEARKRQPAAAYEVVQETALSLGAEAILQVNLTGFVAGDANGPVSEAERAPSPRWKRFVFKKGRPFQDPPDPTDGEVYLDELVNHMVRKFGPASSKTGVKAYALDNEPGLWSETHSRSHPAKVGCAELIERSVAAARAIKSVDPNARVHGFSPFGLFSYRGLVNAPDWPELQKKGGYRWFLSAYLDAFAKASKADGRRLLDVLDLHFYVEGEVATVAGVDGTLQSPRFLWDPTYRNPSWLGEVIPEDSAILKIVHAEIDRYNPGTKICFSEYNPGGQTQWQGGFAMTDMIGAFGRHGVDMATLWPLLPQKPTEGDLAPSHAAFRTFRDYDGKGGVYGDEARDVRNPNPRDLSAWASTDSKTGDLHLVLVGKTRHLPQTIRVPLPNGRYSAAEAYGWDDARIELRPYPAPTLSADGVTLELPKKTVLHIVLRAKK